MASEPRWRKQERERDRGGEEVEVEEPLARSLSAFAMLLCNLLLCKNRPSASRFHSSLSLFAIPIVSATLFRRKKTLSVQVKRRARETELKLSSAIARAATLTCSAAFFDVSPRTTKDKAGIENAFPTPARTLPGLCKPLTPKESGIPPGKEIFGARLRLLLAVG